MIVYGFFFVMLAALMSAAIQVMNMDSVIRLILYSFALPMGLASALI
jgi:hypothetical protein